MIASIYPDVNILDTCFSLCFLLQVYNEVCLLVTAGCAVRFMCFFDKYLVHMLHASSQESICGEGDPINWYPAPLFLSVYWNTFQVIQSQGIQDMLCNSCPPHSPPIQTQMIVEINNVTYLWPHCSRRWFSPTEGQSHHGRYQLGQFRVRQRWLPRTEIQDFKCILYF